MQSFIIHTGLVAPLDRANVDTDQMVPKQFCKFLTRSGYGHTLFYDWRYLDGEAHNPNFSLNKPAYQGSSILLTRGNFGCGSSREHAAWALSDYGFRAILAPSYGDIFYNNCFKNGILPVILPERVIDTFFQRTENVPFYRLCIDLYQQRISDDLEDEFSFTVDSFRRQCLLKGLDEIDLALEHENRIAEYEQAQAPRAPLYSSLD